MISAIATTGLIAWFVRGLLKATRPAVLLSVILVMLYSYVFTILQLQDYALLLGSVGLFLTLGVVMYFTRKLKW
ncbi:MAG: inner membrane CreD family protein [Chitinophagaceae bacterium]|nr:inner membrane CreD family protein [Chitinophagaceae bacterium]